MISKLDLKHGKNANIHSSRFVLGTQSLVPGGPGLTFSGVPLSLATGDSALIKGTSTVLLQPGPTSFPGVITIAGTPIVEIPPRNS